MNNHHRRLPSLPGHKVSLLGCLLLLGGVTPAALASDQVRVAWDKNPHSEAVIGFSSTSGSRIELGTTTDQSQWQSVNTTVQRQFKGSSSLVSNFVRLSGLTADSEYYFKLCDGNSCNSPLYYFKTAANSPRDMTVISGGDSRSSHEGRRQGNRLVAKIRPDYITFGGDYTNNNGAVDMATWLDHWQESFSADQIDGQTFYRVYPIIPTFGNHEANNANTLCETFGTDPDGNGVCSSSDNYFAMNIGGNQTRVYTLNTEYKDNATLWSQQKTWLTNDLANQGSQVNWRVGQYHRSMIPTGGGKTSYSTLRQWAPLFESGKMNLITESDTHIVKYTWPVVPNGSSYAKADAGTVYLGEGSWGVDTRATDTPQAWLVDNASFKQFKLIQFNGAKIDIRTVRFTGETATATLSKSQRDANPLALPTGLDLWDPSGETNTVYTLTKAANQLSQVDGGDSGGGGNTDGGVLTAGVAQTNVTATKGQQINFTMAVLPDAQNLQFTTTGGTGDSDLFVRFGAAPTTSSYDCRSNTSSNNETCAIDPAQAGNYYVMLNAYSDFSGLSLVGDYTTGSSTTPAGSLVKTDLSAAKGGWLHFSAELPSGVTSLKVDMASGSGDADLYVKAGSQPTTSSYLCRPYKDGNTETCSVNNPAAGTWYFSIRAYAAFSGVTLNAQWQ